MNASRFKSFFLTAGLMLGLLPSADPSGWNGASAPAARAYRPSISRLAETRSFAIYPDDESAKPYPLELRGADGKADVLFQS